MLNGWDRRSSVLSATATGAGRSGNSVAQREALHLGAGRPASKENLKNGFLVLDISGSLLRAIPHPRPVQRTRGVALPP
jgi:hypothetical protein